MKMKNLLLGVILGLLAVVRSKPVNNVTQDPAKADEAFLKDAMTEGFIIDSPPTLTTESPKINTTVQASQQPVSNSDDMIEGSASGDATDMSTTSVSPYATMPRGLSRAQISESTEGHMFEGSGLGGPNDESTTSFVLDTAATQSVTHAPTSGFTQSYIFQGSVSGESPVFLQSTTTSVPSEARSGITSNRMLRAGSRSGKVTGTDASSTMMANNVTELPIVPAGQGPHVNVGSSQKLAVNKDPQTQETDPEPRNGHVTPDWIIILGFIVGVAALVMLCVAIATRHKWNRANQATVATSNSSDQQREQEMENFLPSDKPKENGNSVYTVIPLEDLQENGSTK
ncbi:uncharacterized protein LOC115772275 [Archocentrus centrarchus]|uniref:uncharacterized protein LOC115772275 n=1 Tax=Archocentrus centrarchus TaxID=63155 RepID=UPI0011E9DE69|nr:uncharacterized protein LOC115772275 [Archocentrus centrarchus]